MFTPSRPRDLPSATFGSEQRCGAPRSRSRSPQRNGDGSRSRSSSPTPHRPRYESMAERYARELLLRPQVPRRDSYAVWMDWKCRWDGGRLGRPEPDDFEHSRRQTTQELWVTYEGRGTAYPMRDLGVEIITTPHGSSTHYPHSNGGFCVLFPLVTRAGVSPQSVSLGDYFLRGDYVVEYPTDGYTAPRDLRHVGPNLGPASAHFSVQAGAVTRDVDNGWRLESMGTTAPYFNCQLRWLSRFCGHEDECVMRNWTSVDPLLPDTTQVYGVGHERCRAEQLTTRSHASQSQDPPPQGEPSLTFIGECEFGDDMCNRHGPPDSCAKCLLEHLKECRRTPEISARYPPVSTDVQRAHLTATASVPPACDTRNVSPATHTPSWTSCVPVEGG
jgi:hypothetical protein